MHADDHPVTADQVARLLAQQFPEHTGAPVRPVEEFGTDHCLFRVGEHLVARMPRVAWAAEQAQRDAAWLPLVARHLDVAVPVPLALGVPDDAYPFAWSLVPWLHGSTPDRVADLDAVRFAQDLGRTVVALRDVPTDGGPAKQPGERGSSLAHWDDDVEAAITAAGDRIDGARARRAWAHCREADEHTGPPSWLHADLMLGNLLVDDGRLSAVIDWGGLGVGEPAPDLLPYWTSLPWEEPRARAAFREVVGGDEAMWRRGRGWALGPALTGIPYYWESVPAFAERGRRTLARVLEDLGL